MIIEIFTVIFLMALALAFCVGGVKMTHPNYDLAECTRKFKADLGRVLSVLFSGDNARHIFGMSFWENCLKILAEYCHDAFPPECLADYYDGTPRIRFSFVPNRKLSAEELNQLCKLLCLKSRQYLQLYGLSWRMFSEYHVLDGSITISIYYSEQKEDLQPFFKRYRIAVKHASTDNQGVLHDEELDREINYARPKP